MKQTTVKFCGTAFVLGWANEAIFPLGGSGIVVSASESRRLRQRAVSHFPSAKRSHDTTTFSLRRLGTCVEDGETATASFTHYLDEPRQFDPAPVDDGSACCSGHCTEILMTSSKFFEPVLDEDGNEIDGEYIAGADGRQSCECGPVPANDTVILEECVANGDTAEAFFNHTIGEPRIFYPTPVDDGSACCSGHCVEVIETSSKFFVEVVDDDGVPVKPEEFIQMAEGGQICSCGENAPTTSMPSSDTNEDNLNVCTEDGQEVNAYFNHTEGEASQYFPAPVYDGSRCCSGHCEDLWTSETAAEKIDDDIGRVSDGLETCLCGPVVTSEERRGGV